MSSEITKSGEGHRIHMKSPLMRESLISKKLTTELENRNKSVIEILPDCNVLFLGGQSIMDRGRKAILPLLDAVVECRKKHKFVLGIGGGARLRHTLDICLDLGIPTGGMATVAGPVNEQNTRMIWTLLAKNKGISLNKENLLDLPLWLQEGMIPVLSTMPPYHFWEPPNGRKMIPLNGTDIGIYLLADLLGARSMIFLKDEDGLYTNDPKVDKHATFIPKIGVKEILERNFPDLIVEKVMLESMLNAKSMRRIQIINGLKPELLARALNGEHVGTIIDADL